MTEHRESPEIEPESEAGSRPASRLRFARLVESPISRKLALPRLLVAAGLILLTASLVVFGGIHLFRAVAGYVHQRPEHRLPFSRIELDPPPPSFIEGGAAMILEKVRKDAGFDPTLSLLDLNLEEIRKAFGVCAWVKGVPRVEISYGRMVVGLEYRRPVAFIEHELPEVRDVVLDEEGVVLPAREIDFESHNPYRVRGIEVPLIQIVGPKSKNLPRPGVPWRADASIDDPDPMVLRAARLAWFLQVKRPMADGIRDFPQFVQVYIPGGPDEAFYLVDAGRNLVNWGRSPLDERPGDLSSDARWDMLLEWVRAHGPPRTTWPNYLDFTRSGARLKSDLLPKKSEKSGTSASPSSR